MQELLALLIALSVHEAGHYIHYYILGFGPKLRWIGVGPCIEPKIEAIPAKHVLMNIFIAVNVGVLTLKILAVSNTAMFAYFVGCFMDLNNAQMILIYVYRKTITLDTTIDRIKVVIDNSVVSGS